MAKLVLNAQDIAPSPQSGANAVVVKRDRSGSGLPPLQAQDHTTTERYFPRMTAQFFMGYQGLRSHEYVVGSKGMSNSRGYKSELIWNSFKNLLLGAELSGHLKKLRYMVRLNTTLSLANNFIYDYDWLYTDGITQDAYSHYSRHDTVQNIMIELLLRLGFPLFVTGGSKITLGPGIFASFSHWDAFDGRLRQSLDDEGNSIDLVRRESGLNLSYGVLLLSFQAHLELLQNFSDSFGMRVLLAYSPLTLWLDKDNHYLRNLLFYDYGFWGQQVFGELQFDFWNRERTIGLSVALSGRYLFETLGSTLTYETDSNGNSPKGSSFFSAGIEQGSFQIYVGALFGLPKTTKTTRGN